MLAASAGATGVVGVGVAPLVGGFVGVAGGTVGGSVGVTGGTVGGSTGGVIGGWPA